MALLPAQQEAVGRILESYACSQNKICGAEINFGYKYPTYDLFAEQDIFGLGGKYRIQVSDLRTFSDGLT